VLGHFLIVLTALQSQDAALRIDQARAHAAGANVDSQIQRGIGCHGWSPLKSSFCNVYNAILSQNCRSLGVRKPSLECIINWKFAIARVNDSEKSP
jgi:hypothetical protein